MKLTNDELTKRQCLVAVVSGLFILVYALVINLFNFPVYLGGNIIFMICSLFLGKFTIEKIYNFKFKEVTPK